MSATLAPTAAPTEIVHLAFTRFATDTRVKCDALGANFGLAL